MRPFRVDVAQADLDDLVDRLGKTRWPDPADLAKLTEADREQAIANQRWW